MSSLTPEEYAEIDRTERAQRRSGQCNYPLTGSTYGPLCHNRRWRKCKLGYCHDCHDLTVDHYPQYAHQC